MRNALKLLPFVTVLVSCAKPDHPPSSPPDAKSTQKAQLRVSLYPWVPSEVAFRSFVELDFERKNPDIDLIIVDLEGDPAYDPTIAASYLRDDIDLLEVDAMILGDVVSKEVLAEPAMPARTWVPASLNAASVEGKPWGVPHWACGYFIITTEKDIATASNIDSFRAALDASSADIPLAGDMKGEWGTPMVYIDAYRDFFPDASADQALEDTQNRDVIDGLREIAKFCIDSQGNNDCRQDDSALFVSGRAAAYFGYSERLNKIFLPGSDAKGIYIRPVPLGPSSNPVLFTDVVVQSKNCVGDCSRSAKRFLEYYTADATYETVLMAKDVGDDAIPRYLFPATLSAFDVEGVKNNQLYQQMRDVANSAVSYPNTGVFEAVHGGSLARRLWTTIWGDRYDEVQP